MGSNGNAPFDPGEFRKRHPRGKTFLPSQVGGNEHAANEVVLYLLRRVRSERIRPSLNVNTHLPDTDSMSLPVSGADRLATPKMVIGRCHCFRRSSVAGIAGHDTRIYYDAKSEIVRSSRARSDSLPRGGAGEIGMRHAAAANHHEA